jgi:hypothetical protein
MFPAIRRRTVTGKKFDKESLKQSIPSCVLGKAGSTIYRPFLPKTGKLLSRRHIGENYKEGVVA